MTFDISPMQSTASPIALLAGLQGPATSDDFAALLDREGLSERIGEPREAAGDQVAPMAREEIPVADQAVPPPAVAALAIAHADALVATLAPAPEPAAPPAEARIAAPVQITLPIALRPVARRDAPASLPKEEPDEDRADTKLEEKESTPATAVIIALPETPGAQRAADTPPASPELRDSAPTKRAAAPVKMPEIADRTKLPEQAEKEIGRVIPEAEPELAKPAKVEARPARVETATADRPAHVDMPASTPTRPDPTPKAEPVRASKVAEIALGLADRLPDPAMAIVQKQVPDSPVPAPVASATAVPASRTDMIVDRQLDLVRNEQWLGELAHDIASTSGDNNRLSFRLMPRQLGRLDVEVTRAHNGLSLAIHTESDSAQAILTAAQPRLADEIRAQGLRLADTQMFSGDARHSPGHDGAPRPAPLIETFTDFTETADAPEPEKRDGRYA